MPSVTEDRLDARIARREAEAARQKQMPKPQPQPPKPTPAPAPAVKHDTVQISDKGKAAYEQSKQVKPAVVPPRDENKPQPKPESKPAVEPPRNESRPAPKPEPKPAVVPPRDEYRQQHKFDLKHADRRLPQQDTVEISELAIKNYQDVINGFVVPTKPTGSYLDIKPISQTTLIMGNDPGMGKGSIQARAADQGGAPGGLKESKPKENPFDIKPILDQAKQTKKNNDKNSYIMQEKQDPPNAKSEFIKQEKADPGSFEVISDHLKKIGNYLHDGASNLVKDAFPNDPKKFGEKVGEAAIKGGLFAATAEAIRNPNPNVMDITGAFNVGMNTGTVGGTIDFTIRHEIGKAIFGEAKPKEYPTLPREDKGDNIRESNKASKEKKKTEGQRIAEKNDIILEAKKEWLAADARGDKEAKIAAEKKAEKARREGGTIDRNDTIKEVEDKNKEIMKEKEKWKEANARGDKEAMKAAHERAEQLRREGGTIQ